MLVDTKCPPGQHQLPPSAPPGRPTKCQLCRASVRVPVERPVLTQAAHDAAVSEMEARLRKYADYAKARIAVLEAELAAASTAEPVCGCGEQLRCPVCFQP